MYPPSSAHCSPSSLRSRFIGTSQCPVDCTPEARRHMAPRQEYRRPESDFALNPAVFLEGPLWVNGPQRPPASGSRQPIPGQLVERNTHPRDTSRFNTRRPQLPSILNAPTAAFVLPPLPASLDIMPMHTIYGSDAEMEDEGSSYRRSPAPGPPHRNPIRPWEDPPRALSEERSESADSPPESTADPEDKRQWTDFAVEARNPDGGRGTIWFCTWVEDDGQRCSYNSKKQSVKRHISTKHMKIKPYVCDICERAFGQKTARDGHWNTHSDNRPHQCEYCDESFKDASRKLRHKQQAHGYKAKQVRRQKQPLEMVFDSR
ncbi:hypothetical protein FB45DRAFT_412600 [Roridomyces roridus]|uniref:C2H2-type domain-containing protein n=1 Tax=Roridomyces roridus TaxID=1738132 RepID=A0AAD7C4B5_9AGAR|nr:hypothetical protein FB45DRAFT_412600 [Roridomyces roridus]